MLQPPPPGRANGRRPALILLLALASLAASPLRNPGPDSNRQNLRGSDERLQSLPDISVFATNKSDRFIVDFADTSDGHPFFGRNATRPHGGAHIYFDNTNGAWPKGTDVPEHYPKIYAPVDGVIVALTPSFRLTTGADRYGIDLAFARQADGGVYKLCYSIEPFIPEPAPKFYEKFMVVTAGQRVKKGDLIGYMYTPKGQQNTHIHFHLMRLDGRSGFMAPALFDSRVTAEFHEHCRRSRRGQDGDATPPPCFGYKLTAEENPFGTGAVDAL
jgi:hypothetical protein